ncbi:MAG: hypothetical protein ACMXYC_01975 [Candidatus Woesearchaeota archaeon]
MAFSTQQLRYFWRTKYPWFFVVYILVIGLLRGLITQNVADPELGLNILMIAAFTSYVFLYIFYLYGVRPIELEHHFHKK